MKKSRFTESQIVSVLGRAERGEKVSDRLGQWCKAHGVELIFIEPGKPTQNAYIERINRPYDSLGNQTPIQFLQKHESSNLQLQ